MGRAGMRFDETTRLDFEHLISDISSKLVLPNADSIDPVIEQSLQRIRDFLNLDRVVLWLRESGDRFLLTHMSIRPGHGPHLKPFLTTDAFPWITSQLLMGKSTKYSRIDDLPDEASVDKQTIRTYADTFSAMAFPLFNADHVYGILTMGVTEEFDWPDELAPRLRVLAHVFSNALIRRETEHKLHQALTELESAKTLLERENIYLRKEVKERLTPAKIVYQSKVMKEMLEKAEQVSGTNATVLLFGETGTGKEILATAIHEMSARASRTMVRVNCGAIPSALVESEMFGREKGAYTGALAKQIGRFELADASTIFLDEITELPLEVQVKLLRVLQEKEIERLGNPKPIKVDVRVIAATNVNLEKAVHDGKFREDLYYRLNVFPIEVPPLRDRPDDIPMLVWSFVDALSHEFGKRVESVSRKSMDALTEYSWPGNVRELRNTIERAMIMHSSSSPKLNIDPPKAGQASNTPDSGTLKEIEIRHIRKVLETTHWKIRGKQGAAEILGMKPTTLETRMAKLGIIRPNQNQVE
jgi:formate hydrogenlyase transcriptional activator